MITVMNTMTTPPPSPTSSSSPPSPTPSAPEIATTKRPLTAAPLRAIDPRTVKAPPAQRIRIATARSGDTAAGLSAQTAFEQAKTERFVVLNGLAGAGALQAGDKVKIVR